MIAVDNELSKRLMRGCLLTRKTPARADAVCEVCVGVMWDWTSSKRCFVPIPALVTTPVRDLKKLMSGPCAHCLVGWHIAHIFWFIFVFVIPECVLVPMDSGNMSNVIFFFFFLRTVFRKENMQTDHRTGFLQSQWTVLRGLLHIQLKHTFCVHDSHCTLINRGNYSCMDCQTFYSRLSKEYLKSTKKFVIS